MNCHFLAVLSVIALAGKTMHPLPNLAFTRGGGTEGGIAEIKGCCGDCSVLLAAAKYVLCHIELGECYAPADLSLAASLMLASLLNLCIWHR